MLFQLLFHPILDSFHSRLELIYPLSKRLTLLCTLLPKGLNGPFKRLLHPLIPFLDTNLDCVELSADNESANLFNLSLSKALRCFIEDREWPIFESFKVLVHDS